MKEKLDKMKRDLEDRLIEIKKPRNNAVYGVRNGGYKAYIWDRGEHFSSGQGGVLKGVQLIPIRKEIENDLPNF